MVNERHCTIADSCDGSGTNLKFNFSYMCTCRRLCMLDDGANVHHCGKYSMQLHHSGRNFS